MYDDSGFATSYALLGIQGTYYLAYRDLPEIFKRYTSGNRALDFGCGAGRSTKVLCELGYRTDGVDISLPMIERARTNEPRANYHHVVNGEVGPFEPESFDLILSLVTFDNVPLTPTRDEIVRRLGRLLKTNGVFVMVAATPELYTNEWISVSPKGFSENWSATSGCIVRTRLPETGDDRAWEDIFCTDEDYRKSFASAELSILECRRPLASGDEPFEWISECRVAPFVIYVLKRS